MMKIVQQFHCCFKCICIIIAFSMAGFWIQKYLKNEDITVIEYITYNNSDSVHLPSMSICLGNPFSMSNESFGNTTDSKSKRYSKYLQGNTEFYDDYWINLFGRNAWNISDYLDNTAFHCFDLTGSGGTTPEWLLPSIRDGPLQLVVTFDSPTTTGVHIVIFCEFPKLATIRWVSLLVENSVTRGRG